MLGAVAIQTQSADNYYRYGQRKRYPIPDSGNGFSKAPIKVTDTKPRNCARCHKDTGMYHVARDATQSYWRG